jgi:hypothetical protein
MIDEAESKHIDLFCPRCNILVEAKVRATAQGPVTEEVAALLGPEDSLYGAVRYQIALCGRCNGPFLIEIRSYEIPGEFSADTRERVLYPAERPFAGVGSPESVAHAYEQAVRAFQAGLYEPCAIMCRKCIEALCVELQASGRDLKGRLADLEKKGAIDSKLYKWADQLRVVGNDAAHDIRIVIDRDDARDALDFVEAIMLYAFILTKKFESFLVRRAKGSRAS